MYICPTGTARSPVHQTAMLEGNMGVCRGTVTSVTNAHLVSQTPTSRGSTGAGGVTSSLTQEICVLIIMFAREYEYDQNIIVKITFS